MDRLFTRNGLATLFDEDFDQPPASPPAPEPEVIEPVFSAAELAAARETAWHEGQAAAAAGAEQADIARARQALVQIATQLDNARNEANRIAEEAAEAMAYLLCDGFATAFPALSEKHGEAEVHAIVRAVLPALRHEPKITLRLSAVAARAVAQTVEQLDPLPGAAAVRPATPAACGSRSPTSWPRPDCFPFRRPRRRPVPPRKP
jgi:hypothetical protein